MIWCITVRPLHPFLFQGNESYDFSDKETEICNQNFKEVNAKFNKN